MASKKLARLQILHQDKLVVEPWATEIQLEGQRWYELIARAEDQPWFAIETAGNSLTLYVNGRKAVFEVVIAGKVVARSDVVTPSLPK